MPHNFGFVLEGRLAGMERPGTSATLREDLEFLKAQGIGAIVSLTETPLEGAEVEAGGFRYLHLPVVDFSPPTLGQVKRAIKFLDEMERERRAVVVHCGAGRGRTGALLACALVRQGRRAWEAIEELRRLRAGSIETREQEQIVKLYEQVLRNG
ncbi:MAG: dual specificity protein phosphatase family protein [Planctomycetes bacterium]|nr:dual specificity protein phosphatase family protein [Planctomycetota bacterium]